MDLNADVEGTLKSIEAGIVVALRQLKDLEALALRGLHRAPGSLHRQVAIAHLGEALHEVQRAVASGRQNQAAWEPPDAPRLHASAAEAH